jgi:hypothetical protein
MEIIPEYALPVEKWYGADFAKECVEAPDEVEQGWLYDAESGTFSKPSEEEPSPPTSDEPTTEEILDALLGV